MDAISKKLCRGSLQEAAEIIQIAVQAAPF